MSNIPVIVQWQHRTFEDHSLKLWHTTKVNISLETFISVNYGMYDTKLVSTKNEKKKNNNK